MSGAATATRERLLQATEDLLGERPERELTVRDIASRANANVAAVGYHFGSRDALVLATLRRVIDRISQERADILEALPEAADLETVVRAWLAPAISALSGASSGSADWRVLARTFLSGSPLLGSLAEERRADVERTLVSRLRDLLPHLGAEELAWRHAATLGLAGLVGGGGGIVPSVGDAAAADRFVAYVVGALQAPAAG